MAAKLKVKDTRDKKNRRLTRKDVHKAAKRFKNWGRWGKDDEIGTLNFTTASDIVAAARLVHPNIVQVYDTGVDEGRHYIVMEYVEGRSGAQILQRQGPVDPEIAAEIGIEACAGLDYAHRRGIVHRDVKPQNVIVDGEGQAKVADFGIARAGDTSQMTQTGAIVGTTQYLSPEQARGDLTALGPVADVYALGATFYELLTGRPPFRGETPGGTLARVLNDDVVPPRRLRPELSQELEAVCLKCLEKVPAGRYASARELEDDLRRWRNGEATRVRPWSWRRRPAAAPRRAPTASRPGRRRRRCVGSGRARR